MVEIKNRFTGEVICSGGDLRAAVCNNLQLLAGANLARANLTVANLTRANLARADLTVANLTRANLARADLAWADLPWANLTGADLAGANLTRANLTGANLAGANLARANLAGANLARANLTRANLTGANLAWKSHDLLAEILRRAAGDETEKLKVAGYILICRDKCWKEFAAMAARDPLGDWALDTLAAWGQEGDDAPEIIADRRKVGA